MKRFLGILIGLVVFALATVLGLTVATSARVIDVARDYDMPVAQTQTFVTAATRKLGWGHSDATPGAHDAVYSAPLLPWNAATIRVIIEPKGSGSHVIIRGHAVKAKELSALLKRQLPALP